MLAIKNKGGQAAVVVVCDHCGKVIEHYREGNYQWVERPDDGDAERDIWFTHKRCSHDYERAHKPLSRGYWCSMELSVLPVYLARNLQIGTVEFEDLADYFARD